MNIGFISDTHGQHNKIIDTRGIDVLCHCGDVSGRGTREEVMDFLRWFVNADVEYKVFIPGNHDFYMEQCSDENIRAMLPENCFYLNDSGVEINGVKFYGSPVQPWFFDWAFNRHRGNDIRKHWDLIPQGTDVLITHGPPYKILDQTARGEHVGCYDLLKKVEEIKPKIHAFGHIHEGAGLFSTHDTTFINASVLDERYVMKHKMTIISV